MTAILRSDQSRGVTRYIRTDAAAATWDEDARTWVLEDGKRRTIDLDRLSGAPSAQDVETLEGYLFTPDLALTFKRAVEARWSSASPRSRSSCVEIRPTRRTRRSGTTT